MYIDTENNAFVTKEEHNTTFSINHVVKRKQSN
jgi:hypothetical protein